MRPIKPEEYKRSRFVTLRLTPRSHIALRDLAYSQDSTIADILRRKIAEMIEQNQNHK